MSTTTSLRPPQVPRSSSTTDNLFQPSPSPPLASLCCSRDPKENSPSYNPKLIFSKSCPDLSKHKNKRAWDMPLLSYSQASPSIARTFIKSVIYNYFMSKAIAPLSYPLFSEYITKRETFILIFYRLLFVLFIS